MHSEAGLGRKLPVVHRLLILVQMMKGQVQKFRRVGKTRFQVGNIIIYCMILYNVLNGAIGCPIKIQAVVHILHCISSSGSSTLTFSPALTMVRWSGFPKFVLSFLHFPSLGEHSQVDREWIVH